LKHLDRCAPMGKALRPDIDRTRGPRTCRFILDSTTMSVERAPKKAAFPAINTLGLAEARPGPWSSS
jgi:hypothetical protein